MKTVSGTLLAVAAGAVVTPALAADLTVKLTLPTLEGDGRRAPRPPYVAVWLRKADKSFASNLAVWYQTENKGRRGGPGREGGPQQDNGRPGGARWLNEVRDWWADSGNQLRFPVDGLTSASRPAGTYELTFAASDPKLANLQPGNYLLMVEAAREHGGDETLSIPFSWPVKAPQSGSATGHSELGAVSLVLKP